MNIGKQSTLNDLKDLQINLETKIEEAKAIKVGEVSQIESGHVMSGDFIKYRPNGVYHIDNGTIGIPDNSYTDHTGMLISMAPTTRSDFVVTAFVAWSGEVIVSRIVGGVRETDTRILTDKNTIVDANGFIKTA